MNGINYIEQQVCGQLCCSIVLCELIKYVIFLFLAGGDSFSVLMVRLK